MKRFAIKLSLRRVRISINDILTIISLKSYSIGEDICEEIIKKSLKKNEKRMKENYLFI